MIEKYSKNNKELKRTMPKCKKETEEYQEVRLIIVELIIFKATLVPKVFISLKIKVKVVAFMKVESQPKKIIIIVIYLQKNKF